MTREERYSRLLRWYPTSWRSANGPAIIGVLMDSDDANGRVFPPLAERLSLVATGLWQRERLPLRAGLARMAAHAIGLLIVGWYAAVIAWSPGFSSAGGIGPFSNPAVLVTALLVLATVLATAGRHTLARWASLASIAAILVVGALSAELGWMGPGVPGVAVFVAAGVLAATPLTGLSQLIRLVLASALFSVGAVALSVVTTPGVWLVQVVGFVVVAVIAFAGSALLAASVAHSIGAARSPA